ncbi:NADH-quinone oxidoreductase subunit N [Streptomyces sp. H27-D2]|uniref:NADH-quinone oxidoreductase subunit N n=1 Tax=Streptomyces sp. H27-D2 TaxID=3046304 RepID=UPI002DBBBB6A|nr:NADH-quinone oxidoreductase subunit N [Streptomyces sp. H27-D2]MEC4018854.1 NADH-quinone oxidoreductase subunit N [Streptomyces sp. H27-D2]
MTSLAHAVNAAHTLGSTLTEHAGTAGHAAQSAAHSAAQPLAHLAANAPAHLAPAHLAAGPVGDLGNLVQSVDWLAIAPPVITALVGLIVLVADLFMPDRRKPLLGWIATGGLALAGLSLLPLLDGDRSTFCLNSDAAVCSYTADHFTLAVQFLVLGGAFLTALLSIDIVEHTKLPAGEYWFLLLSSAAGAALLPASRDLATLVVALEVASLPAFALVGLKRGDRRSSEAALKFFLSSVAATAVMLLGVSFVYAATGSMHLSRVAEGLEHVPGQLGTLATAGVALTLVGFAFKTAAVPFHFWVPDTYVGAPLPIAAYLSVVGKAVGFTGLILVTVLAFPSYADVWGPALAVLAALTMTLGNAAALRQRPERAHSAVRLLAWSSVGQAGYLLVPIAAAGYASDPSHAIGSTVAYALMYAAVNLGAFAVAALVGRTNAANRLSDYRGLYATRPLAALALGFFLLCLAGLPPGIIGLFAKVTVFSAAVDAGLGWLAAVMAVNVVIALYYYLQWTALLFRAPEPAAEPASAGAEGAGPSTAAPRLRIPAPLAAAIGLAAVLGIALSGAPQLVLRFAAGTLL